MRATITRGEETKTWTHEAHVKQWEVVGEQHLGSVAAHSWTDEPDLWIRWRWDDGKFNEYGFRYEDLMQSSIGRHLLFHFERLLNAVTEGNAGEFDASVWASASPMETVIREAAKLMTDPNTTKDDVQHLREKYGINTSYSHRGSGDRALVILDLHLNTTITDLEIEAIAGTAELEYLHSNRARRKYVTTPHLLCHTCCMERRARGLAPRRRAPLRRAGRRRAGTRRPRPRRPSGRRHAPLPAEPLHASYRAAWRRSRS